MKLDIRSIFRKAIVAMAVMFPLPALAASILPQGVSQFLDDDGNPLSAGTVNFYIPSTTTPKTTWQDASETIPNANPVELDAAGRAIIYGSGTYRMIVKDVNGVTIYDAITAGDGADSGTSPIIWGGTSGGGANTQTITAADFTGADGQVIAFIAGLTNTGPLTIDPENFAATAIRKDLPAGPIELIGGEVRAGNVVMAVYNASAGYFHLINQPDPMGGTPVLALTAAATTDVLGAQSTFVTITGAGATIASLGSKSYQFKTVLFDGINTLEHGATLKLPGSVNITTASQDTMGVISGVDGNARVVWYQGGGVATFNPGIDNEFTAAQTITITGSGTGTGAFLRGDSTAADDASGPNLNMYRDSASPAALDQLSQLLFRGNDSLGNSVTYGSINALIADPTDASEDGLISLSLSSGGATITPFYVTGESAVLTSVDAGAAANPTLEVFRDSATPADNDVLGVLRFLGRDDAAETQSYGRIFALATDVSNGTEDGVVQIRTPVAGADGARISVGAGVYHDSATGTDKGANTINFGQIYRNGSEIGGGQVSAFRAQRASIQAISATTDTDIAWNSEQFDNGSDFSTPTWTPPAGYVFMSAAVTVTAAAGTDIAVRFKKNGTTVQGGGGVAVTSTAYATGASDINLSLIDIATGTDGYKTSIYCTAACVVQFEDPSVNERASYFQGSMIQ